MRLLLGQLYDFHTALHLEHFYVGEVLIPQERLNADHLREAVRFIVNKYPVLRARFSKLQSEWKMDFLASDEFDVDEALVVLAPVPQMPLDVHIQGLIDEPVASSALEPPLLRYALLDAEHADNQRLVVIFHHLVCDGISSRILWRDLSRAYRASKQDCRLSAEICDSYPVFAEELAQRYRQLPAQNGLALGNQRPCGVLDRLARAQIGKVALNTLTPRCLQLESTALEGLRQCAAAWRVSLSDCLLGCWVHALSNIQDQCSVEMMMWVSPHFVGEWNTPVAELVGSVSFPVPTCLSLDAGRSCQQSAQGAAAEVQRAITAAQDFAIRHFSGVADAPAPDLPGIGFNFVSSQRPGSSLIGYRLAPEQLCIRRDPGEMADLALSFEAEVHAQTLRITVLAVPEMERQLSIGVLIDQLFERVRSIAAATC